MCVEEHLRNTWEQLRMPHIFPQNIEGKYFSVIVEETFKIFVWSSTLEHNFKVFLDFSLVWWDLFHVDHSSGLGEQVLWVVLFWTEWNSLVVIEPPGEVIAADDSELPLIYIEINTDV